LGTAKLKITRHPELVSGSPAIKGDAETSSARQYIKNSNFNS